MGEYEKAMGRSYVPTFGKDGKLVKGLLKSLDLDALKGAAIRMFQDPWAVEAGASVGLLASQINKYLGDGHGRVGRPQDSGRGGGTARRVPESLRAPAGKYASLDS
ncbi:MAG: hypothetical protein V2A58_12010 [Planctomycetota bacterium]